jgi:hypothetical protein
MFNRKKTVIYFVYGPKYKNSGATVMRGRQLPKIITAFNSQLSTKFKPTSNRFSDKILFLTKGAIQSLNPTSLSDLKSNNNILLFDPVDSALDPKKVVYADILIAASQSAYDEYVINFPNNKTMLLDHHVDPRVATSKPGPVPNLESLKIGYFGELVNTLLSPKINKFVTSFHVDTSKQKDDWFNQLKKFNMHYIVRNTDKLDVHKPFLKGFTAAHMDSNVIAHYSQNDSVKWLGIDYPYLIKGDLNEKNVLAMIEYAHKTYGKKEWNDALRTMNKIKEKTSSRQIYEQFLKVLNELRVSY